MSQLAGEVHGDTVTGRRNAGPPRRYQVKKNEIYELL